MRIVIAAALASLLAAPALAGNMSTMRVGLTVTGRLASPLIGSWHASGAARGTIYHFVVKGGSGAFYQLVSVPLRDAGICNLRVSGAIYSLEPVGRASSYEMNYSVRSADVVTSSTDVDACKDVAAAYLNDIPAGESVRTLLLSQTAEGRLIDSATGAEYIRSR